VQENECGEIKLAGQAELEDWFEVQLAQL